MKRLRVGFVGVGKWATELREAFETHSEICEIYGYYRQKDVSLFGFGERFASWKLLANRVDLMVAAGPPEITTEVALWCAENCKSVLATKPLLEHPEMLAAPFYIDLWRLWSLPMVSMHNYLVPQTQFGLSRSKVTKMEIDFHGTGPYRTWSKGLEDWGPHALTFLFSLLGIRDGIPDDTLFDVGCQNDEKGGELFTLEGTMRGVPFILRTGNGSSEPRREVVVTDWHNQVHRYSEKSDIITYAFEREGQKTHYLRSTREHALNNMTLSILEQIEQLRKTGLPNSLTINYSMLASEMMQRIRNPLTWQNEKTQPSVSGTSDRSSEDLN